MPPKEYIAVIIDVYRSRGMLSDDRMTVQKALAKGIEDANCYLCGKYGGEDRDLFVQFDFSDGDSVMGLCRKVEDVARAITLILNSIGYDAPVYVAIGRGQWTTRLDHYGINAQDGPAFWHARIAMEWAKYHNVCFIVADDSGEGWTNIYADEKFEVCMNFIEYVADELDWKEFNAMIMARPALKNAEEIFTAHYLKHEAKKNSEKKFR